MAVLSSPGNTESIGNEYISFWQLSLLQRLLKQIPRLLRTQIIESHRIRVFVKQRTAQ